MVSVNPGPDGSQDRNGGRSVNSRNGPPRGRSMGYCPKVESHSARIKFFLARATDGGPDEPCLAPASGRCNRPERNVRIVPGRKDESKVRDGVS